MTKRKRAANQDTAVAALQVAMRHALTGTPNKNRQYAMVKDLAPAYAMLPKRLRVQNTMKHAENVVMQRRIANRTVSPYVQILQNSDDLTDVKYALRQVTNASSVSDASIRRRFSQLGFFGNASNAATIRRVKILTELLRSGAGSRLMAFGDRICDAYIQTRLHAFFELLDAFASRGNLKFKVKEPIWAFKYVQTGQPAYIRLIELVLSKKVLSLKDVLGYYPSPLLLRSSHADNAERARQWSRLVKVLEVMTRHGLNTADFVADYFVVGATRYIPSRFVEVRDLIRLGAVVDARPAGWAAEWGRYSMLENYILLQIQLIDGLGESIAPQFNSDILKLFQRAGLTVSRSFPTSRLPNSPRPVARLPPAYTAMLAKYKLLAPSAVHGN